MEVTELSHGDMLACVGQIAERALERFGLDRGSCVLRLINVSENATFEVRDCIQGRHFALRVHRDGYHSLDGIRSELSWLMALRRDAGIVTPVPIAGLDGEFVQTLSHERLPRPRNVVLFHWEAGSEPAANDVICFGKLGAVAARMHAHVRRWERPTWFQRHTWTFDTSLGRTPHWGRWRDGLGMTPVLAQHFSGAVDVIERRLAAFGMGDDRFGLVHGDMRLANLLVEAGEVKVIDFDDCGQSWFLYDCATAVSFFEDAPEVPDLIAAWVRGYRKVGQLSAEEEAEIPTFVMLRRLLLIAWIGSHAETDLAQSMGVAFTQGTVRLVERYLTAFAPRTSSRVGFEVVRSS